MKNDFINMLKAEEMTEDPDMHSRLLYAKHLKDVKEKLSELEKIISSEDFEDNKLPNDYFSYPRPFTDAVKERLRCCLSRKNFDDTGKIKLMLESLDTQINLSDNLVSIIKGMTGIEKFFVIPYYHIEEWFKGKRYKEHLEYGKSFKDFSIGLTVSTYSFVFKGRESFPIFRLRYEISDNHEHCHRVPEVITDLRFRDRILSYLNERNGSNWI